MLASGEQSGPLEALEAAAEGNASAVAAALEVLDSTTPEVPVPESKTHPSVSPRFLMWCDGVQVHALDPDTSGERLLFDYGPPRARGEVLEVMAKALLMLSRGEVHPWS